MVKVMQITDEQSENKIFRLGSSPMAVFLWLTLILFILSACSPPVTARMRELAIGDPERGLDLVQEYGCNACHVIPGVRGPKAWVGPPLNAWSKRHYIAGSLANTPENLQAWLQRPQEFEPGTAMPNLNISTEDAQDISAYLYTLQDE